MPGNYELLVVPGSNVPVHEIGKVRHAPEVDRSALACQYSRTLVIIKHDDNVNRAINNTLVRVRVREMCMVTIL